MLIVDIQGNLAHLMPGKERLFKNVQKLIKGIQVLGIPTLWVEQNPQELRPTIPEIADILNNVQWPFTVNIIWQPGINSPP